MATKIELAAVQNSDECEIGNHCFDCGCSDFEAGAKWAIKEFADKLKKKLYELNGYVSAIEKMAIEELLKEYEEE
jgi:hypothetical protein